MTNEREKRADSVWRDEPFGFREPSGTPAAKRHRGEDVESEVEIPPPALPTPERKPKPK